jgi:hypothetical protein
MEMDRIGGHEAGTTSGWILLPVRMENNDKKTPATKQQTRNRIGTISTVNLSTMAQVPQNVSQQNT